MPNPFTYCELHTPNTAEAKTFYTRLFGWSMNDLTTPGGTYTEIKPGEGIEGGLMAENGESEEAAGEDLSLSSRAGSAT